MGARSAFRVYGSTKLRGTAESRSGSTRAEGSFAPPDLTFLVNSGRIASTRLRRRASFVERREENEAIVRAICDS
jgi:hypothetical protein